MMRLRTLARRAATSEDPERRQATAVAHASRQTSSAGSTTKVSGAGSNARYGNTLSTVSGLLFRSQHANQLDREREDDRRVLLRRDLRQRLQIAQRHSGRLPVDDGRGLGQLVRGDQFTFS